MKRAVATITVYVYAKTVDQLIKKGQEIAEIIYQEDPECDAKMEKLHLVPFGKIGHQEEISLDQDG